MRARLFVSLSTLALGLLALPHCKTTEATSGAAPSASASATATATATAPALPPMVIPTAAPTPVVTQVKVISNGAMPRRELRYKYKGAKEADMTMELGMTVQMGTGAGEPGSPVVLPTTRLTMHVKPKSVSDAGDLSYEFEIKDIEVATDSKAVPAVIAAMKASMDKIKGVHGSGVVTNQGESKSVSVSLPPEVAPQVRELMDRMRQQLGDVAVQLPTEAVGKGAEWEKTAGFMANGLLVEQHAKYTLTSLEGDMMKLAVVVTQTAQPQEIKAPGLPPGSKVYLETLEAKGTGEASRDLTKLVGRSSVQVTSNAKNRMMQAGKEAPMTLKVDLTTTTAPKESKDAKDTK